MEMGPKSAKRGQTPFPSSKNIEKISKDIQHLTTGFHKLKIKIVEMPEKDKPDEEGNDK